MAAVSLTTPMRPWCAEFRYPGRAPFIYGTIWTRANAPLQEVEKEASDRLRAGLMSHLPTGIEEPKLVDLRPGQIVFVDDELAREAA